MKIADNGGFNYGASKHRAGRRVWIISLDVKWRGGGGYQGSLPGRVIVGGIVVEREGNLLLVDQ